MYKTQKAFTMIELVFVIVIIGILSAIAIPRLSATRTDAIITKAISTVSSVRMGISTSRQAQILSGNFNNVATLTANSGNDVPIFETVLTYPLRSCKDATSKGCWIANAGMTIYTYRLPISGTVDFNITSNRFICDSTDNNCRTLTE